MLAQWQIMSELIVDPIGGAAGDMLLGGLLDLEIPKPALQSALDSLDLTGWKLQVRQTWRFSIACKQARFTGPPAHKHRHLPEILNRIDRSELPAVVKTNAKATFQRLAEAEAQVHRIPVNKIHFHEVGAADAILDICGTCWAIDYLSLRKLYVQPLPSGSGSVKCEHGEMPCPAPAVLQLLQGFVLLAGQGTGEMVTPTAAALISQFCEPIPPEMRYSPIAVGYGAGTRESSFLRMIHANVDTHHNACPSQLSEQNFHDANWKNGRLIHDQVLLLECNLDDLSPELLGTTIDRLIEAGALDVSCTPTLMKKGRPGFQLCCLLRPSTRDSIIDLIFSETTTLGIREQWIHRSTLLRRHIRVDTKWGSLRIKQSNLHGKLRGIPEFSDCISLASQHKIPIIEVYLAGQRAHENWLENHPTPETNRDS